MTLFWSEFLFFGASMFGILVAYVSASLFYETARAEHHTKTIWRAAGFFLLACALALFILERKYGFFGLTGTVVEAIGFFAIYRGVRAQPKLSPLLKVRKGTDAGVEEFHSQLRTTLRGWLSRILLVLDILALIVAFVWVVLRLIAPAAWAVVAGAFSRASSSILFNVPFLPSLIILLSLVFILLTIRLQIRRYREEKTGSDTRRNNLYPLIGYLFLAIREIALAGYRLPKIDLIWTRYFNGDYNLAWMIAAASTALGFLFLAIWAWRFVRVRFFLRTYAVFLALTIAVATASVLVFSLLIFQVVEKNNLELMARGANTESLIMVERKNVAETIARLLTEESRIVSGAAAFDPRTAADRSEFFTRNTNVDSIRFFSPDREVLLNPTDGRDVGRVFPDDRLLGEAIERGTATTSFDVTPGVLSDVLVGRALYPLASVLTMTASAPSSASGVLGVFDVAYAFDNAFVDYSKQQTGLEVTMYTGKNRSASTILTDDGTSRWVGSAETDSEVLANVLEHGSAFQTSLDRLGTPYYSAFLPVRDIHGGIIGMVSVGVPSHILLEDARQRFLTSYFLATAIAVLAAIAGYFAFRNFARESSVE